MKVRLCCTIIVLLALCAACGQAPSALSPTPAADPVQALVGNWTTTVTKEDILRVMPDFKQKFLCDNAGTFVWKFKADGTFTIDQTALSGCPTLAQSHIESTWSNEGNLVTFAKGAPDQEVYEWAVKDDMLTFTYRSGDCVPCQATNTANPWKRSQT
jgi:hypothetical protein